MAAGAACWAAGWPLAWDAGGAGGAAGLAALSAGFCALPPALLAGGGGAAGAAGADDVHALAKSPSADAESHFPLLAHCASINGTTDRRRISRCGLIRWHVGVDTA